MRHAAKLIALALRGQPTANLAALLVFGSGKFHERDGGFGGTRRVAMQSGIVSQPYVPHRRVMLRGKTHMFRKASRDTVGVMNQLPAALLLADAEPFGCMLTGERRIFLAMRGAQIAASFQLLLLQRLPSLVFFDARLADMQVADFCVEFFLLDFEFLPCFVALFAILDGANRLPFFGGLFLDLLEGLLARVGVMFFRPVSVLCELGLLRLAQRVAVAFLFAIHHPADLGLR